MLHCDKLKEEELKQLNKSKQSKSKINESILSDNEKTLVQGRKLQEVLAKALHRLCKIPTKENGNDFKDVKHFEERLNIEIQIYKFESRQIYKGKEYPIKVYILMFKTHYDVISLQDLRVQMRIIPSQKLRNVKRAKAKLNAT